MVHSKILLVLLAVVGLGCHKANVLQQQAAPDGGKVTDGPGFIVIPPDASSKDGRPGSDDISCSRSVNLRGISITRPVPFDVIIVADNTDSLSWSRDSLSSGLKNLLAHVHGHEARFFVLTTTQYGASSQAAVSPITGKDIVSWRDPVTQVSYAKEMTAYQQDCTDGNGAPRACPKPPLVYSEAWNVKGTWKFTMPAPVAAITPDMDDTAIASEQKRISDAILALGGGGSEQEQPICTLLRYIGQDAAALPKHAVFVVLTDEDDSSPPEVCLAGYQAQKEVNASPNVTCESNCASYVYLAHRPNQELDLGYTCVPTDDKGTAHPELATQKTLVLETISQCAGDAGSSASLACNSSELTKATTDCGAGNVVQNCTHNCVVGKGSLQCNLIRSDNKIDACTQPFDWQGAHYLNMADYCSRKSGFGEWTCQVQGLNPAPADAGFYTSYGESSIPLNPSALSTADMIKTFKDSANRLIGSSHFSVETIILDPSFSCQVRSGQSYGTNLRTLASSSSDVFPLCEDYAPAVARIADFADYLIQTTFPLDLDPYEAVDTVVVTNKQSQKRTIATSGYKYDDKAKQLIFSPGALTAQDDTLAVNVARECHIIIR
jgi:hypothetical protein